MTSQHAQDSYNQVRGGLQALQGSEAVLKNIIAWCARSYKEQGSEEVVDKTKEYVKDVANSVAEHMLYISTHLTRFLDVQIEELVGLDAEVSALKHRYKSSEQFMTELYTTKFQAYRRPRTSIGIKRRVLSEKELPKYNRTKRPFKQETKIKFNQLDSVGQLPGYPRGTLQDDSSLAQLQSMDSVNREETNRSIPQRSFAASRHSAGGSAYSVPSAVAPESSYTGEAMQPPSSIMGPPPSSSFQTQFAPPSMTGPPSFLSGPPGGLSGPPGSMPGPPPAMPKPPGPPPSMPRPPR